MVRQNYNLNGWPLILRALESAPWPLLETVHFSSQGKNFWFNLAGYAVPVDLWPGILLTEDKSPANLAAWKSPTNLCPLADGQPIWWTQWITRNWIHAVPASQTRRWAARPMRRNHETLIQCLCRWPNIKPSSAQGPCFSFHAPAAALSPWQLLPSARSSWWFRGSLPWRLLESADPPPFWGK